MLESIGIAAFLLLSLIGFRFTLWWVVAALAAHGVFDWFPRAPDCGPWRSLVVGQCSVLRTMFVAAAYLFVVAGLLKGCRQIEPVTQHVKEFSRRIGPYVQAEFLAAKECDGRGDFAGCFEHLERGPRARPGVNARARAGSTGRCSDGRRVSATARASSPGVAHCRRRRLDGGRPRTRRKYRRRKCERLPTPARPARNWQQSLHRCAPGRPPQYLKAMRGDQRVLCLPMNH